MVKEFHKSIIPFSLSFLLNLSMKPTKFLWKLKSPIWTRVQQRTYHIPFSNEPSHDYIIFLLLISRARKFQHFYEKFKNSFHIHFKVTGWLYRKSLQKKCQSKFKKRRSKLCRCNLLRWQRTSPYSCRKKFLRTKLSFSTFFQRILLLCRPSTFKKLNFV